VSEPQLVVRNRSVHRLLLGGVDVSFAKADGEEDRPGHFIDFAQPSQQRLSGG
jgi:type I restriction enzyme R subunit